MRRAVITIAMLASLDGAAHAAPDPSARPAVLAAQLAAIGDPAAFLATLAPDTIVIGNGRLALAGGPEATAIIATLGGARRPLAFEATRVDVGRSSGAIWLTADLTITHGRRHVSIVRLSEMIDAASAKVIAIAFSSSDGAAAIGAELGRAGDGPLTAMLDPSHLDSSLRADDTPVVTGPGNQVAIGADDAHRALADWRDREVHVTHAIEIHTAAWGLAAGDVVFADAGLGQPRDWRVLVFAIPDGDRWHVVCAHVFRT